MPHPLNRIASRISGLYKRHQKAWIFLFCLLLAAVFWTFNSLNKTYVHTIRCAVGTGESGDTISLTLQGKGIDLFSLLADDSLPVSMPAPETYFGSSYQDTLPREVPSEKFINYELLEEHHIEVINIHPEVIIPAQQTVSTRRVPVRLVVESPRKPLARLAHGPMVTEPDSVNVYGPYSTISSITEVKTRAASYPEKAGVTFEGLYLENPDPSKVRLSTEYVWLYCDVAELTESSLVLPVRSTYTGDRYKLTTIPAEVRVIYQAKTAEIGRIRPEDFAVSAAIVEGDKRAVLQIDKKPDAALNIRIEPSTVEYYLIEQL